MKSPILSAAGALGYEPSERDWEGLGLLGAFTTPILTLRAWPGTDRPSLARTVAGYVLCTGQRNPGVRGARRRYEAHWGKLEVPVIAAILATSPQEVTESAASLADAQYIQAIEIHLRPEELDAGHIEACVRAVQRASGLPCLVCVPPCAYKESATAAESAGADAVVVAAPFAARVRDGSGAWASGSLHSPALLPVYVEMVHDVTHRVGIPVIGRGGIASLGGALDMLAAGAVAVQIDSTLYREPNIIAEIYQDLEQEMVRRGTPSWEDLLADLR